MWGGEGKLLHTPPSPLDFQTFLRPCWCLCQISVKNIKLAIFISFSSSNSEHPILLNLNILFVSFFPNKSFELISKCIQKCQNNSLYWKVKTLCNTLNWGKWNSGFIKLGVRWADWDNIFGNFESKLALGCGLSKTNYQQFDIGE